MKPIRVISSDFNQLAEIDNYESLQFTRRWFEIGEFELHINRYKNGVDTLQKGNLFVLGGQMNKVGFIKHREIALDENGKATENFLIKGPTLQGLMIQRVTVPPANTAYDNKSGYGETVMKHYVDGHFINPTDANRKISQLIMAADQARGAHIDYQSRFSVVSDELTTIAQATGLGWNVILDLVNKQWIFDVYEGRDLTASQNINPPVIFSPDFESIKTQGFTDSDLNMRNYAYVGGQGEGTARTIETVGDKAGIDRVETFIDARDIDDTSTVTLDQRGQQKLDELSTELFLEGQILTKSPFVYEEDYDLGDMVTVMNKGWGVTEDTCITEIKEIYEPAGFQLEATFGQSRPTLISKIKNKFNEVDKVLKQ